MKRSNKNLQLADEIFESRDEIKHSDIEVCLIFEKKKKKKKKKKNTYY